MTKPLSSSDHLYLPSRLLEPIFVILLWRRLGSEGMKGSSLQGRAQTTLSLPPDDSSRWLDGKFFRVPEMGHSGSLQSNPGEGLEFCAMGLPVSIWFNAWRHRTRNDRNGPWLTIIVVVAVIHEYVHIIAIKHRIYPKQVTSLRIYWEVISKQKRIFISKIPPIFVSREIEKNSSLQHSHRSVIHFHTNKSLYRPRIVDHSSSHVDSTKSPCTDLFGNSSLSTKSKHI